MILIKLEPRERVEISDGLLAYQMPDGTLAAPYVAVRVWQQDVELFTIPIDAGTLEATEAFAASLTEATRLLRAEIARRVAPQPEIVATTPDLVMAQEGGQS